MSLWESCTLMQLRYFATAVELGSLSASAKRWRVAQSTVSQSLKKLEEICQGPLLEHRQGSFEPTALGLILYQQASHVLKSFEGLKEAVAAHQRLGHSGLRVGTSHSVALNILGDCLIDSKILSGMDLHIDSPDTLRRLLNQDTLDAAIVVQEPGDELFEKIVLWKGYFALFTSSEKKASHCLLVSPLEKAHLESIATDSLKEMEWVQVRSWQVLADLAQKGHGLSFLPDYLNEVRQKVLIEASHLKVRMPYELSIIYRGLSKKKAIENLANTLKNWLKA